MFWLICSRGPKVCCPGRDLEKSEVKSEVLMEDEKGGVEVGREVSKRRKEDRVIEGKVSWKEKDDNYSS